MTTQEPVKSRKQFYEETLAETGWNEELCSDGRIGDESPIAEGVIIDREYVLSRVKFDLEQAYDDYRTDLATCDYLDRMENPEPDEETGGYRV